MIKLRIITAAVLSVIIFTFSLSHAREDESSREMYYGLFEYTSKTKNRSRAEKLNKEALKAHKSKDYKKSEKLFYRAARLDSSWEKPFFNLACATALQKKYTIALGYLELAFKKNPATVLVWAKKDSDLKDLRNNKEYKDLIARYESKQQKGKYTYVGCWRDVTESPGNFACLKVLYNGSMLAETITGEDIFCQGTWKYNKMFHNLEMQGTCSIDTGQKGKGRFIKSPFRASTEFNKKNSTLIFQIKPDNFSSDPYYFYLQRNVPGCVCGP